jgi:tetratricopeptide (TPR) repeat protein
MSIAALERRQRASIAVAAVVHAALVLWAAWAWIHGPFGGRGVVDGAEFLSWARTGEPDAFGTKSPLYPTLLRGAFAACGDSPWTVALLGLALSLATLAALVRAACEFETPRAAPWAAWGWALSGSATVFAVQPLEAALAACLLAWTIVAVARAERTRSVPGIALAVAAALLAVLARAPLAVPLGAALAWLAWRRAPWRALCGSLAIALALTFAVFGSRAWPSAAALNLRLANGGARSGTCELRPGPAYDALRYDETFDARRERDPQRSGDSIQLALLGEELADDPTGALRTIAAKAFLFWHRAELVSDADFVHGLARFPPAPALAWSFALIAPLALLGLVQAWRTRMWLAALVALGAFAIGIVFAAAARYRFPALPALVLLAASFVASRPRPPRLAFAALLAVVLAVDWTGRARPLACDGLVEEAHLLLAEDRRSPRARELLREALLSSRDPVARYELALASEYDQRESGSPADLERAAELYRAALELEPRYAEASGNLLRVLLALRRYDEAVRVGTELAARDPRAGTVRGNLALAKRTLDPAADVRELEREAHQVEALRAWAERALDVAREHARSARDLGSRDPRIAWLAR